MIKWKQNTENINDQKETKHRLSLIIRKQKTKTINDQKETAHTDYQ